MINNKLSPALKYHFIYGYGYKSIPKRILKEKLLWHSFSYAMPQIQIIHIILATVLIEI